MNTRDRLICFRNTGNIEDIVGVTNSSVKDIEITHSNNGELHNIYIELDKNIDISTGYGKYSNIVLNTKGYRLKTPDKENESEIRGMKDVDESEKGLWDSFVKENGMLEWEDYTEHFIDSFGDFNDRLIVRKQADWDKIITKLLNGDTFENKVIQLECDVKHTYYNSDNFLNSEFAGILDGRMHKIKAKIVKGGRKEPDEEGTPNNENEQDIDRGDRAGFVNRLTGCVYNTYIEVDSDALKGIVYGVCIENSGEIENVSIKINAPRKMEGAVIAFCKENRGLIAFSLFLINYKMGLGFLWLLLALLLLLLLRSCGSEEPLYEMDRDRLGPPTAEYPEVEVEETTVAPGLNVMSFEFPMSMEVNSSDMSGNFGFYAPDRGNKELMVEIWLGEDCLYESELIKPGEGISDITLNKQLEVGKYTCTVVLIPYKDGRLIESVTSQLPFDIIVR